MKTLCIFLLLLSPLLAQDGGSSVIDFKSGITDYKYVNTNGGRDLLSDIKYTWQITRASNGDKTFQFIAYGCIYTLEIVISATEIHEIPLPIPFCKQLSQSTAEVVGPIDAGMTFFNSLAPGQVAHTVVYGPFSDTPQAGMATVQPSTPPDPQIIMLDGLGNSLLEFDLNTYAVTKSVVVPNQSGPFGIRPSATGIANEVWVSNGGLEVSVVDLGAQQLLTNILTPSIPAAVAPAAIVFTNSGATALEAVKYFTPDASGNQGALLVLDAVNRSVKSTLLLKDRPIALVMAPDGLTAYLLDDIGTITYYDVLSGTADLSASTYTPGMSGGYGLGAVFIHPDGTRLFWHTGPQLDVFDLTTRKVTRQFDTGLSGASEVSMQMSQDGSTMWFANALGNVVILDTRYGNIMGTYQTQPGSQVFPSPAF